MNPWIEMFSGTAVDLIQPDPETIRLDDIAHHLARIYRYTGGTEWSVAAHSLCVAMLVPREFRLEALLHDAHEAYVGDVSSPMKSAMRMLLWNGVAPSASIASSAPSSGSPRRRATMCGTRTW